MPAASGTTGTWIRNHATAPTTANACPSALQGRSHAIVMANARASNVNGFERMACERIMGVWHSMTITLHMITVAPQATPLKQPES